MVVEDDKDFSKLLKKLANGAAPGPSAWTGDLVRALAGDQPVEKVSP